MMGGEDGYLIATRIEADGVTLHIRDEEGYPRWRGGPDWAGHRWFDPDDMTTITGTLSELQGLWSYVVPSSMPIGRSTTIVASLLPPRSGWETERRCFAMSGVTRSGMELGGTITALSGRAAA